MMSVYNVEDFPHVVFGEGNPQQARNVRIIISPELNNEKGITVVTVALPAGSLSDAHVHEDNDEYICFNKEGFTVINGVRYEVPANSIVHAPKGSLHACGNESTDESIHLICIYTPALKPYGKFFELIEKTKRYLQEE